MINCTFENGRKSLLRHVTVGAIVVNDRNQVLLVKRAPNIHNGGKYTIPGGFLDRDETTGEGTLRELFEEAGIKGKIKFLFRVNDTKRIKEDRQNVDFIYVVETLSEELKHDDEISEVKWFDQNSLPPDEEFAFDHRDSILKYFSYLKEPIKLPIIG
ncbi:MAG: NUDIX hydrolase [Candidatus Levybacteria bacterium]|nr:NUDIX hydrolase [Candidatus Levybacteria bacterium]